jgi:UDP-2,3-diacylglucosamine pyrophosphatase LpxH
VITDAAEERLVVVSDLHLGNPASDAAGPFRGFLEYVREERYSLCINGDGFEMLQTRFARVVREAMPVMSRISRLRQEDLRVYYVVGNHDIYLEHFLDDWMVTGIGPFLNLTSGGKRIRIEHGHIYDPIFSRAPDFYESLTRILGLAVFMRPDTYRQWDVAAQWLDKICRAPRGDDRSPQHRAAAEVLRRGFDAVVHGHTHRPEITELDGGLYVNGGAWLHNATYVEIDHGRLELRTWPPT